MTQRGTARLGVLAWRNIWRNRRRTLITVFGIVFGVLMAVVMTGLGDATYRQMINYGAKMGGGHVTVQHEDYQRLPSLKKTVADTVAVRESAIGQPGVVAATERITGAAMLATARHSLGTFFIGFDPTRETADTFGVLDAEIEGEFFTAPDQKKAVVLGRVLADNLSASLGSKVVYTISDKNGEMVSSLVRVVGIVETGAPSLDASLCLLPIDIVRKDLGYADDEATLVAILLDNHRDADDTAERLDALVSAPAAVLTWDEVQPDLAGLMAIDRAGAVVFETVILLLLAAGIFNTLFVSVMERMREFGIMAALGFSSGQLFALVVWESVWLALVGLFASVFACAGPYYYLSTAGLDYSALVGEGAEMGGVMMEPILYIGIYPDHLLKIVCIVIVATIVSGLYPAWRAGRANPADAIRLV